MSGSLKYTYCSDCHEMTMNHNHKCPCCGSENVLHDETDIDPSTVVVGENDVIRWELMDQPEEVDYLELDFDINTLFDDDVPGYSEDELPDWMTGEDDTY